MPSGRFPSEWSRPVGSSLISFINSVVVELICDPLVLRSPVPIVSVPRCCQLAKSFDAIPFRWLPTSQSFPLVVLSLAANESAEKILVEPKTPRIRGRQRNRHKIPAESPEEYYRKNLAVPSVLLLN